ncbi:hypothetical protein Vi05172_g2274 [Venturia inaequalis]|nr:hypothetical protein Vi05172_g2274 [Venturia inaequalis]
MIHTPRTIFSEPEAAIQRAWRLAAWWSRSRAMQPQTTFSLACGSTRICRSVICAAATSLARNCKRPAAGVPLVPQGSVQELDGSSQLSPLLGRARGFGAPAAAAVAMQNVAGANSWVSSLE